MVWDSVQMCAVGESLGSCAAVRCVTNLSSFSGRFHQASLELDSWWCDLATTKAVAERALTSLKWDDDYNLVSLRLYIWHWWIVYLPVVSQYIVPGRIRGGSFNTFQWENLCKPKKECAQGHQPVRSPNQVFLRALQPLHSGSGVLVVAVSLVVVAAVVPVPVLVPVLVTAGVYFEYAFTVYGW